MESVPESDVFARDLTAEGHALAQQLELGVIDPKTRGYLVDPEVAVVAALILLASLIAACGIEPLREQMVVFAKDQLDMMLAKTKDEEDNKVVN